MNELSRDAVLLRYAYADSEIFQADGKPAKALRVRMGILPWDHFSEKGGVSFYVESILAARFPHTADAASVVERTVATDAAVATATAIATGTSPPAPVRGKVFVVRLSVSAVLDQGYQVFLDPTDDDLGFAHAVITCAKDSPLNNRSAFKIARKKLLPKFSLAGGNIKWLEELQT